jgi:tRNA (guanine37-N1)-methyltransferase
MLFDILTLFPNMFQGVLAESIVKRALDKGLVSLEIHDIRGYATGRHKTVDDYLYGGDAGMLLKPGPVAAAIMDARSRLAAHQPQVIYLSPRGEVLTHALVNDLSRERALILLCGHYKGIDQRVCDKYVDRELSIGDYVLSGGEIPAMVLIDAVVRLLPGALGNFDSAAADSFFNGLLGPPHYTRPEVFEDMRVPEVLISGHHKHVKEWQMQQAVAATRQRRPDLWARYCEKNENSSQGGVQCRNS